MVYFIVDRTLISMNIIMMNLLYRSPSLAIGNCLTPLGKIYLAAFQWS